MRLFLILLTAAALLAAGCAGNRPGAPGIAPSQQASLSDGSTGWSVPPGAKPGDTAASEAPADAAAQAPADEAALAAADRRQREEAARRAREKLDEGQPPAETPPATTQRREPLVKPIVPAFPARVSEDRVATLRTVHFAFDKWDLTAEAKALLDENARWLKANPEVVVRVEGHADERGTPEYNLALGERRATRVRNYLIEQGVPADNLLTSSYGEEMPIDPGHSETAWSVNRRAEFSKGEARQVSDTAGRTPSG